MHSGNVTGENDEGYKRALNDFTRIVDRFYEDNEVDQSQDLKIKIKPN